MFDASVVTDSGALISGGVTSDTVNVTSCESESPAPSVTVNVIVCVPTSDSVGVHVNSAVLELVADMAPNPLSVVYTRVFGGMSTSIAERDIVI